MWKRVTAKVPAAETASSRKRGVGLGCRHETILASIFATTDCRPPGTSRCLRSIYHSTAKVHQIYHRHHHTQSRFSRMGHIRDTHHISRWDSFLLNRGIVPISTNRVLLQRRTFQTTPALHKSLSSKTQKNSKKGNKTSGSPKSRRAPPAHKMAAGMGMTLQECSDYLIKECMEVRSIESNKRQRLKPWIMALLVHRYDRGIRDIDELNTDSVYYNGGRHPNISNKTTSSSSIDLRNVLTPDSMEIDEFTIATQNSSSSNSQQKLPHDKESIRELLRQDKLALLATEARRILIDRDIPFRDLAALQNEAGVRKLSKQDPSVFLSLFSRAFCVSEKKGSHKRQGTPDFSHRRFQPPSLKTSTHKKKKLKEKRDRELLAAEKNAKSDGNRFHKNSPKALQQKLRAMGQRNQ